MALYEPTGLRYLEQSKTYNGYTLFGAGGKGFLIDMEGNVINTWKAGSNPRFLENGNLLDMMANDTQGFAQIQELNWQGEIVWQYRDTREQYAPHHAFQRIYNKKLKAFTTLYVANRSISNDEAIAIGCDPKNGPYDGSQMDTIVEVDMQGNIIWEWRFIDHVIQDFDPGKPNYVRQGKTIADYPGRLNINMPGRPLRRDWIHLNSMDYNQELDQIVTNSVQGEFWVIDHGNTFVPGDTKRSISLAASHQGDFLYRFGDPARYGQGKPPSILADWTASTTGNKQIGGSHDIQWIGAGLSGSGHFLLFNNAQYLFERTPQSYILEINPFLDAAGNNTGKYVNPPDAGYYTLEPVDQRNTHKQPKLISKQVVWIYGSKRNTAFFSHIGSSCQRLPNGNTLVCSMTEGQLFEVTPDSEVVWEYIAPITRNKKVISVLPDCYPMTNAVFAARRYGPGHPALAGKDLTPKGKITSL